MSIIQTGGIGEDMAQILLRVDWRTAQNVYNVIANVPMNLGMTKVSRTKASIQFGKDKLVVDFGKGKGPYIHVEIHSADKDGNNLQNMTVDQVIERYDRMADWAERYLNISVLKEQRDAAVFVKLELNVTFPTKQLFAEYTRTLRLVAMGILSKSGKKGEVSSSELESAFELETLTCKRGTYKVRIYAKDVEMREARKALVYQSLMRVELVCSHQLILTDFPTDKMTEVTQEMVEAAFRKRAAGWRKKAEQYLEEKSLYHPTLCGARETVANIIASKVRNMEIMDPQGALLEMIGHENKYGVPLLFDITDLSKSIVSLQKAWVLNPQKATRDYYLAFNSAYASSIGTCEAFYSQNDKIKEFFEKVNGYERYALKLYE